MRRPPRPLPAWWPEGRPWPPPDAAQPRPRPGWWPEGHAWPSSRTASADHRDTFPLRLALLLALAINIVGGGGLLLSRGVIGAFDSPYAWPLAVTALVVATAAAFVFAMRRIGSPLSAIVAAAHRVGGGDFSVRIEEAGLPWLRSLASAFNTMTSRLERQQQERRALMADIAHELRTPVAIVQGRLEGMLDGVYPRDEPHVRQVLDETRVLARLVEDLRTSAHTQSGTLTLQKESTDLEALIDDAAAESADPRVHIDVRVSPGLPMMDIDPHRIRQVLRNLLSNAVRHSPDGGRVAITCDRERDSVIIRIADEGPGIPPAERSRVFERFYKSPGSKGSGLGLTIAKGLVTAHRGTIEVEQGAQGGTVMKVVLPV